MKKLWTLLCTVFVFFSLSGIINAQLTDNGDGTITQIRNDGSRLMWLKDANPTKNGYPLDEYGRMKYSDAKAWAENLTFGGYDDWRLPKVLPINPPDYNGEWRYDGTSDRGYNITSPNNEMAYLFYVELGNYADIGFDLIRGPFVNLEPYYSVGPGIHGVYFGEGGLYNTYDVAWIFNFYHGTQNFTHDKDTYHAFAWAVRDAPTVTLEIDIKPGSDPNCININGHGVIPVAILGSANLNVIDIKTDDTLSFNGLSVRVRGKKGPLVAIEDSNGDGFLDLVCHFEDDPNEWLEGDNATATIKGELTDGTPIEGTDSICIVP